MSQDSTSVRDARFQELNTLLHSVTPEIFDPFQIYRSYYESDGLPIEVDIFVPKKNPQRKVRPVLVRIHGGFLVSPNILYRKASLNHDHQITGSSLFPAWFSKWILDFAELHDAIIISPNYRLLPEVKGVDILRDMQNFWAWIQAERPQQHLSSIGRSDIVLDISQMLLVGESAGILTSKYP